MHLKGKKDVFGVSIRPCFKKKIKKERKRKEKKGLVGLSQRRKPEQATFGDRKNYPPLAVPMRLQLKEKKT